MLIEGRDALELMRDQPGEHYVRQVGHPRQPRMGSRVPRKALTATQSRGGTSVRNR